ncbi:MAG: hypothetical protein QGF46_02670, partial [Planctomycetota bacterium]|nr:hypothetical protein [Planctomycetota bacterium]
NSEFLGGLVEGLRDPITCISGGLQMVKMGGDGAVEFIEPALRAALQISEQLQYVELASTDVTPHFDSIDLSDCANSIKKDLSKLGYDFKIKVTKGIRVYSEPSFAAASLKACFLLLHRFGLQGDITLVSDSIDSKPCLIWEQKNSGELAASSLSPPPYLQELITKLSDKAETTVVIDKIKDIVPTRAGLIFNK